MLIPDLKADFDPDDKFPFYVTYGAESHGYGETMQEVIDWTVEHLSHGAIWEQTERGDILVAVVIKGSPTFFLESK